MEKIKPEVQNLMDIMRKKNPDRPLDAIMDELRTSQEQCEKNFEKDLQEAREMEEDENRKRKEEEERRIEAQLDRLAKFYHVLSRNQGALAENFNLQRETREIVAGKAVVAPIAKPLLEGFQRNEEKLKKEIERIQGEIAKLESEPAMIAVLAEKRRLERESQVEQAEDALVELLSRPLALELYVGDRTKYKAQIEFIDKQIKKIRKERLAKSESLVKENNRLLFSRKEKIGELSREIDELNEEQKEKTRAKQELEEEKEALDREYPPLVRALQKALDQIYRSDKKVERLFFAMYPYVEPSVLDNQRGLVIDLKKFWGLKVHQLTNEKRTN